MMGQAGVSLDRGQFARSTAFVRDRIAFTDAEGEGRIMIEEK